MIPTSFFKSKIFYIPLILGSLVASFYLFGIIFSFLAQFSSVFTILIMAWIIAVALRPIVRYLEKKHIPREISITISFIVLFLLLVLLGLFVLPPLYDELNVIFTSISSYDFNQYIIGILDKYNITDVNPTTQLVDQFKGFLGTILSNIFPFVSNFVTFLLNVALSFFFAFYFLYEGDKLKARILKLIPDNFKDDYLLITESINQGLTAFIKGQTIIALIGAIVTMVMMKILGLNLVLVSGVYVLIAMYFPIIGPLIGAILPLVVALGKDQLDFFILGVFLLISMQLILNIIGPKVLGKNLGLHPVLVVLAFLIGAQLFGFIGALLALPAASVLQSLLINYFKNANV